MASGEPICPRCGGVMVSGMDHLACAPMGFVEHRQAARRARTQALITRNAELVAANDALRREIAKLKGG